MPRFLPIGVIIPELIASVEITHQTAGTARLIDSKDAGRRLSIRTIAAS